MGPFNFTLAHFIVPSRVHALIPSDLIFLLYAFLHRSEKQNVEGWETGTMTLFNDHKLLRLASVKAKTVNENEKLNCR